MGDDPGTMARLLVAQRAAALGNGADPRTLWTLARAHAAAGEMEAARDAAKQAWETADRLGARALADPLLAVRRSLGGGRT